MRRYSAEDEVEGLLRQVRVDHNLPPTTAFTRLINLPGNRRALLTRAPLQLLSPALQAG